jgi:hypothetical protein
MPDRVVKNSFPRITINRFPKKSLDQGGIGLLLKAAVRTSRNKKVEIDTAAVGASLIFGLVRAAGAFAAVLPTFVVVSRTQIARQYCDHGHLLTPVSSSRHETGHPSPVASYRAFFYFFGRENFF